MLLCSSLPESCDGCFLRRPCFGRNVHMNIFLFYFLLEQNRRLQKPVSILLFLTVFAEPASKTNRKPAYYSQIRRQHHSKELVQYYIYPFCALQTSRTSYSISLNKIRKFVFVNDRVFYPLRRRSAIISLLSCSAGLGPAFFQVDHL